MCPASSLPHEFFPQPGDLFWTPADWAWAGGLLNVLLPSLHLGVAGRGAALRQVRSGGGASLCMARAESPQRLHPADGAAHAAHRASGRASAMRSHLRTLASGGEALGAETYAWGREALGLTINEFYGQTECNLVLASCAAIGVARAGRDRRAVPGHEVAIIRPDGSHLRAGRTRPDRGPAARSGDVPRLLEAGRRRRADKFIGDWMTTGDQGTMDADGYVCFVGRDDDVITSSGYRIGPGEIEDCLLRHPAVAVAAVDRQAGSAYAPRSSRLSSSCATDSRRRTPCRRTSSPSCARGCPRTNIRARSCSSANCR